MTGDRVKAKYQGNAKHAWYAGTAGAQNADGSWLIKYDDMEEEDLHVYHPGSSLPSIMHLDDAYVPMPATDGDVQSRAKDSRGARTGKTRARNKMKVRHICFKFMRVEQARGTNAMAWPVACTSCTKRSKCGMAR